MECRFKCVVHSGGSSLGSMRAMASPKVSIYTRLGMIITPCFRWRSGKLAYFSPYFLCFCYIFTILCKKCFFQQTVKYIIHKILAPQKNNSRSATGGTPGVGI